MLRWHRKVINIWRSMFILNFVTKDLKRIPPHDPKFFAFTLGGSLFEAIDFVTCSLAAEAAVQNLHFFTHLFFGLPVKLNHQYHFRYPTKQR